MIRYFVPALVVLFAGCCFQQPGSTSWNNPFDNGSRIAPPATGTAVPNGAAPYYQPPPTINGQLVPLSRVEPAKAAAEPTPASATVENRSIAGNTSSTGFREVGASETKPADTRLASHSETEQPTISRAIRIEESSNGTSVASSTSSGSRTFVSSPPRDISSLPAADAPKREVAVSPPSRPASDSRTNFGYRPDYSTLQGRLEYSAISGQWKLRYIPIDGKTDNFGGSVVLVDKEQLADFEDGDFVTVDGEVGRDGKDTVGFAPAYHLNGIRRL